MKQMPDLSRLQRFFKKYKFVALVLCAGIALMLLPVNKTQTAQSQTAQTQTGEEQSFDLDALERRVASALSEINGVGEVTVVLTLRSSAEDILAQDSSSGTTQDEETVIISTGSSTEQAVRVKTIYPEFQGALVVCEGGGSSTVKWEVLQAVSAITGLSSDQISICQRK